MEVQEGMQLGGKLEAVTRMRITYIVALALIALVTLSGQLYLHSAIADKSVDATAINVAGRQRMLSQRIAKASLELAVVRTQDEHIHSFAELSDARDLLSKSHAALKLRDGTLDLSGANSPEIQSMYLEIDDAFVVLVGKAGELLARAESGPLEGEAREEAISIAKQVSAASVVFLPKMHAIVNAHEADSQARIAALQRLEMTLAGIVLGLLLIEALLVFEPALRTIRRAINQAQNASRAKSDFLANMSHEIRTPMNAILGYTDLLQSDDLIRSDKPGARDAVTTIRNNGQHLLSVINDILDMSKIESGKMTIESTTTNPAQIAEEVASLLGPKAVSKSVDLGVTYARPVPRSITSDPTRLRQILLNLAGNAIKFTAKGEVRIVVDYDPETNDLSFAVRDTGIGMNHDQLRVIREFGAFTQADTTTTRTFGGTGLGLCISNTFAQMMGGEIRVDSREGEGSVFTVHIEARPDKESGEITLVTPSDVEAFLKGAAAPGMTEKKSASTETLQGLSVLLAEDGPDNQRLLSHLLRRAGAKVTVAANGAIAVDEIEAAKQAGTMFDVVFMDMQMPEMDGYTATTLLRNRGFKDLPIIALTAHAMASDRDKCLKAGCDDFVSKPVNSSTLIATAERYGKKSESRDAA